MSDEAKSEVIKASLMLIIVACEWWAMQPYHEPLLARAWLTATHIFQAIARFFGRLALAAEFKYFEVI